MVSTDEMANIGDQAKDIKIPDAYNFDITTVKVLKRNAVTPLGRELPVTPPKEEKPGGPPTRSKRWGGRNG
jgi:hypothetical protein